MTRILIVEHEAPLYAAALHGAFEGLEIFCAKDAASVPEDALGAEVLIGLAPFLPDALLARMPKLAWIHALTTGVDNLLASPVLAPSVALSRSRGIHGPQMSELAILMMLSLARDLSRMLDDQRAGRWDRRAQPLLDGKTACLIGLGAIAEALASRLTAMGMRVTGVSGGRAEAPGISHVFARAEIGAAMAEADFAVVITPYGPSTHHIVDAAALAAMKRSAFLINISRGGCVDEDALMDALTGGRIAGAGLDVFASEPLAPDSPFRAMPNVIVTPHVGGMSDSYAAQAAPIIRAHLRAWLDGAALPDQVTRQGA